MAVSIRESVVVRRDVDLVAKIATDPRTLLPMVGGFGRFEPLRVDAVGCGEWDLFIDIGVTHVGGRVVVSQPDPRSLAWLAVRGTRHQVELTVEPHPQGAQVTMAMRLELAGGVSGWIGERLARGVSARHLVAGLEQLRHHLEHEI